MRGSDWTALPVKVHRGIARIVRRRRSLSVFPLKTSKFPPGSSQEPMFRLVGTAREHKRRTIYETGHDIPRNEMIKESLDWLDRYLGPVK